MIDAKILYPGVHAVVSVPGPDAEAMASPHGDRVAIRHRFAGNSSWLNAHSLASASIPALSLCAASTKTFFLL